jgi:serine/threonine-protein kinase RsbW
LTSTTPHNQDSIVLSLPINPAYVSAARLTASSIANRIGFGIDEIEDVKMAVSEACTFVIRNAPNAEGGLFKIVFTVKNETIEIMIECQQSFPKITPEEELGQALMIIKNFTDELIISYGETFSAKLIKTHKRLEL